ncbi:MAG: hypothetical protein HY066_04970 [Betaproteobacteria bacterium]|nr:hypothetical protein [Betaproteobacteria bacterium]
MEHNKATLCLRQKRMRRVLAGLAGLQFCLSAQAQQPAPATDAKTPEYTVTGNATLISDYIWRGLTQTWGRPAMQAGVEAAHASGAYAGFWASNVSSQWVPGATLETDWYGGVRGNFAGAASGLGYDVGAIYVYYPGSDYSKALNGATFPSSKPNTVEVSAAISYKWVSVKYGRALTKFFGWDTSNSSVGNFNGLAPKAGVTGDTKGSSYVELNASGDIAEGLAAAVQVGRQKIANSTGLDWSYYKVAITKSLPGNWAASASLSGSNQPQAYKNYGSLTGNGDLLDVGRTRVFVAVARNF